MEILDKISMRNISKLTSTEESVTDLTVETKEYTRKLGADIVGIALAERFQCATSSVLKMLTTQVRP